MTLAEYTNWDATEIAEMIRTKQISAKEAARWAAEAIASVNSELNAVIEVFDDRVENPPEVSEGILAGVPILNKDLSFSDAGRLQEMGSRLAAGFRPDFDSTSVLRMKQAGLNLIGRTTTPEFGNSGLTESLIAGLTRNPWDTERIPGGSSGGSAAIVAARAVPVATAGDGGGSTRTPASLCGLVGLKATRGLIPVGPAKGEGGSGLTGPFAVTRSVRDCAAMLDIMAGYDPGDPYLVTASERSYRSALTDTYSQPLMIAWSDKNWAGVEPHQECKAALLDVVSILETEGHHLTENCAPALDWEPFFDATVKVMCANLATGIETLSDHLARPIRPGLLQSSTDACYNYGRGLKATDFLKALNVFNSVTRDFSTFFRKYDVLVLPTNVFPAQRVDETYSCNPENGIKAHVYQEQVYSNDHFLAPFNTTGQPSITVPTGMTSDGLPVGVQIVSQMGEEKILLRLARRLEEAVNWAERLPRCNAAV